MYKHKTTLIKCFWSFCSKPQKLETPITRSNFNFPWQFELPGFNCMLKRKQFRKDMSVICSANHSNKMYPLFQTDCPKITPFRAAHTFIVSGEYPHPLPPHPCPVHWQTCLCLSPRLSMGHGGKPWMSNYDHPHYQAGIEATKIGTYFLVTIEGNLRWRRAKYGKILLRDGSLEM